jgi:hypothetical protein
MNFNPNLIYMRQETMHSRGGLQDKTLRAPSAGSTGVSQMPGKPPVRFGQQINLFLFFVSLMLAAGSWTPYSSGQSLILLVLARLYRIHTKDKNKLLLTILQCFLIFRCLW